MADLADVEAALVALALGCAYPNGADQPSITGKPVRVYRGWPMNNPLGRDLASGIANISIYPVPGATVNTTRWAPRAFVTQGEASLALSVSGNVVTVAGTAAAGQLAGVLVGEMPFVYAVPAAATPALVSAMLAQSIRAVRPCWLAGTSFTVPGAGMLVARCVAAGATLTEWARQRQAFRVGLWCPSPAMRDTLAAMIDGVFAATAFLALPDGTSGRLRYRSTAVFDEDQDGQLYRRDLVYEVEYGTTTHAASPAMLFGDLILHGASRYG